MGDGAASMRGRLLMWYHAPSRADHLTAKRRTLKARMVPRQAIPRLATLIGAVAFGLLALTPGERGGLVHAQQVGAAGWSVLLFTRTEGFRHDSIPDGIDAVARMGAESGFGVDATEDPAVFSDTTLATYRAVVFLLTTGRVLDREQQLAFERYINAGGGYVGVHSATDTEYDWAWYGGLVGAYFASHPAIQPATLHVED